MTGKTVRALARLPLDELATLDERTAKQLDHAKQSRAMLDAALELRFGRKATAQLFARSQTTGTAHLEEDGFAIRVEVPKKVIWDAEPFAGAIERLQKKIGDWRKYVVVRYELSETSWKAMPPALQKLFAAARQVERGKPRITLRRKAEVDLAA